MIQMVPASNGGVSPLRTSVTRATGPEDPPLFNKDPDTMKVLHHQHSFGK